MKHFFCFHCHLEHKVEFVGRQDVCDGCGRDLRVCKNCKNHDQSANNQCREDQAPRQVEKEKSNFCEWFATLDGVKSSSIKAPQKSELRAAADALFKKKS
jgi:inorganic pyrophosphatase